MNPADTLLDNQRLLKLARAALGVKAVNESYGWLGTRLTKVDPENNLCVVKTGCDIAD